MFATFLLDQFAVVGTLHHFAYGQDIISFYPQSMHDSRVTGVHALVPGIECRIVLVKSRRSGGLLGSCCPSDADRQPTPIGALVVLVNDDIDQRYEKLSGQRHRT